MAPNRHTVARSEILKYIETCNDEELLNFRTAMIKRIDTCTRHEDATTRYEDSKAAKWALNEIDTEILVRFQAGN